MKKVIHNVETGEITEVNYSKEEMAEFEKEKLILQNKLEIIERAASDLAALKASAKAKLIAGEPLTATEADTLVI